MLRKYKNIILFFTPDYYNAIRIHPGLIILFLSFEETI